MKKTLSLILALVLSISFFAVSLADDENEIPGTVDMPSAGIRFVPPEELRAVTGTLVTDGAIQFDSDIWYAYWIYFPMTEDEFSAAMNSDEGLYGQDAIDLFYVFSIGGGLDFDAFNSMLATPLPVANVRKIGREGDVTFYLYVVEPNQDFADALGGEYRGEYLALAESTDQIASGFTCYEPVDPYAALIGSVISFETTDLDGNPVSSAELFAQNEVTLVNIWATWCGPCVGELADLQELSVRLQEKGCGLIGLLDDDDLDSARQLIADNGVAYPVILAPDNLYSLLPITAYPTTFYIGRDGSVVAPPVIGAYVSEYENLLSLVLGE